MDIFESKADVKSIEKFSRKAYANGVIKKAIETMLDPTSNLTEDERRQYEQKVMAKLKSGKHLTSEEMNYLKLHNPVLYRTALRVELAKQRLKEQLKHCKSKEEAKNVICGAISGVSDKDPDREYIVAGLQETAKNYRKDSHYARLPETIKQEKKSKIRRNYDFDDEETEEEDGVKCFSPIYEVLESLPVFDVVQ